MGVIRICIPSTRNVLSFQDFIAEMLKYLRRRYYVLHAWLPVVNTTPVIARGV